MHLYLYLCIYIYIYILYINKIYIYIYIIYIYTYIPVYINEGGDALPVKRKFLQNYISLKQLLLLELCLEQENATETEMVLVATTVSKLQQ